ncbi:ABC transporter substrate-binding protein [Pikeienuella piscinae]|uniref:ABC transporter substrate-binding protein n=2 Tax=Pikeienuella piscinae TaxID=2748098 RepID=A0A7M3T7F9_9RHOB|nr:ABC transporter substrate-binding protein [Pikeienuella piscinae]
MFFRAFRHQAYDISELSLSSYCVSLAKDDAPYVAVPVFLSRAFRHSSIYIRTDRGIAAPEDLRGRKIGIAEYQLTANVWARALLTDAGVPPDEISWVRGGMDTPGRPEKMKLDLPPEIRIEAAPEGATLNGMLAAGAIDGFMGPRWPRCFHEGHPHVGRLFADTMAAAEAYHARTGIFPIMHVLGVRRSLAERHPWLPGALFKAFSEAKRMAVAALSDTSATKVTMPFVEDTLARAARLSDDLWSYGARANEHVLTHFLDQHHRQGLSPRKLAFEELFHPSTMESYSL